MLASMTSAEMPALQHWLHETDPLQLTGKLRHGKRFPVLAQLTRRMPVQGIPGGFSMLRSVLCTAES